MKTTAIIAAIVAAGLGAIAWGAIGALTGFEIGILAWAIGGLVGVAVRVGGGGGQVDAAAAAILAMLSIFAGKALLVEWAIADIAMEDAAQHLPTELYREYQRDAADWQEVDSSDPAAVDAFIVSHGYAETTNAADVDFETRSGFRESRAPMLVAMHEEQWTEDEWRANVVELMSGEFLEQYSWLDRIKDSLGLLDIIFIFLGVSTAFKIAAEGSDEGGGESSGGMRTQAGEAGAGPGPPPGGLSPARPAGGGPPPGGLSPPRPPSGSSSGSG